MQSQDTKSLRQRLDAIGVGQNVFATVAKVHEADVSRHCRGLHVSAARVAQMNAVLEELEDLAAADHEVRIDFSSVANIKAAQKRLAEARQRQASAPWSQFNATADFADAPRGGAAGLRLSGATNE